MLRRGKGRVQPKSARVAISRARSALPDSPDEKGSSSEWEVDTSFSYESDLHESLQRDAAIPPGPVSLPSRTNSGVSAQAISPLGIPRSTSDLLLLALKGGASDLDDSASDLEALSVPVPLQRSRSFQIADTLDTISTTLFEILFKQHTTNTTGNAGIQRSANSAALAWDAPDESDEEEEEEEEAWVRGPNGEEWPIPDVPSIEPVSSVWLHEQVVAHANIYKHAADDENPLLGNNYSHSINKFINARWVHALLDTLRGEDSRLSSPRLSVLRSLYRFGTGENVDNTRVYIAHCLSEVTHDHAVVASNMAGVVRQLSVDPAKSGKQLTTHGERDRGHSQVLELLEFAVLCENQEVMMKYRENFLGSNSPENAHNSLQQRFHERSGSLSPVGLPSSEFEDFLVRGESSPRGRTSPPNVPLPLRLSPSFGDSSPGGSTKSNDGATSIGNSMNRGAELVSVPIVVEGPPEEKRLILLLHACCGCLKALDNDEFIDSNGGSSRDDAGGGHNFDSEVGVKLLYIMQLVLNVSVALGKDSSERLCVLLMKALVRHWPRKEQCSHIQIYIKAVELVLGYVNPSMLQSSQDCTSSSSVLLKNLSEMHIEQNDDNVNNEQEKEQEHCHLPTTLFKTKRRGDRLAEICLGKLLQMAESQHTKLSHAAIQALSSPAVRALLLKEEHDFYSDANASDSSENEPVLMQLVSILRRVRGTHWHPQCRAASDTLLEELTEML